MNLFNFLAQSARILYFRFSFLKRTHTHTRFIGAKRQYIVKKKHLENNRLVYVKQINI